MLPIHFPCVLADESITTSQAQKLVVSEETFELPSIEVPEVAALPTEGVDYSSLSAIKIKQLVDRLTSLVYHRICQ